MTHIDRNNRLSHLRAEIVAQDADVRRVAKAGVVAAIATGVALIESKTILGTGNSHGGSQPKPGSHRAPRAFT